MLLEQVLGLILEMVEVGIRWEASYRHDELPFVRQVRIMARKLVRENELLPSGDFCPFRGPDAPFALRRCYHDGEGIGTRNVPARPDYMRDGWPRQ